MGPGHESRLTAGLLKKYGLPDIVYPIPEAALPGLALQADEIPLEAMLKALQQSSQSGACDWRRLEPAMDRIAELLAGDRAPEETFCLGENWWLELGPVDLNARLVTIQRSEALVAAISTRADGRLRVAVYRPLDSKSAGYLVGLGLVPHPEHGVCMRENNWEYALDSAANSGNYYASDQGESYLAYWERGLGVTTSGQELLVWRRQLSLMPRTTARVSKELAVHCAKFSSFRLPQLP